MGKAVHLGYELTRRFAKGKHAFIICTHVDKVHMGYKVQEQEQEKEADRREEER